MHGRLAQCVSTMNTPESPPNVNWPHVLRCHEFDHDTLVSLPLFSGLKHALHDTSKQFLRTIVSLQHYQKHATRTHNAPLHNTHSADRPLSHSLHKCPLPSPEQSVAATQSRQLLSCGATQGGQTLQLHAALYSPPHGIIEKNCRIAQISKKN